MVTANDVKSNIQSLITTSNTKTGKSDTTITDAVKTLLDGYGQGGGGINIVDELPEVGDEGSYYSKTSLTDLIVVMEYVGVMSLAAMFGGEIPTIIATSERFPTIEPNGYRLCYVPDMHEIYMNEEGAWVACSTGYGDFLGEINNKNEADPSIYGYYAVVDTVLYQYTNGQYNKLVKRGDLLYTSNNDGTCYVSGIEKYHEEIIRMSPTSPNGDTITAIGDSAFKDCIGVSEIHIADGVTSIGNQAFEECCGLKWAVIPASVTNIGDTAFCRCRFLATITFQGTVEQWNAITKGGSWNSGVATNEVLCSDDKVYL